MVKDLEIPASSPVHPQGQNKMAYQDGGIAWACPALPKDVVK
jgi:hypothetical protein